MKKKENEFSAYYNKVVTNIKSIAAQNGESNSILQISKRVNIPYSTLNNKMNNPSGFTLDDMYKISKGLHTTIEKIFG